jgi:hypothetical protein
MGAGVHGPVDACLLDALIPGRRQTRGFAEWRDVGCLLSRASILR